MLKVKRALDFDFDATLNRLHEAPSLYPPFKTFAMASSHKDFNADCLPAELPTLFLSPRTFSPLEIKNIIFLQVEASCHELTRLSGLIRQHSRKRKSEENEEEEAGPEWKRKSPDGKSVVDEDLDFREGGDSASMEKMARINVREYTHNIPLVDLII